MRCLLRVSRTTCDISLALASKSTGLRQPISRGRSRGCRSSRCGQRHRPWLRRVCDRPCGRCARRDGDHRHGRASRSGTWPQRPLQKLQFECLLPNQGFERCNPRLTLPQQVGRAGIFVEGSGLILSTQSRIRLREISGRRARPCSVSLARNSCATRRLNSMLWDRCRAMLSSSESPAPCQTFPIDPSIPRGPLRNWVNRRTRKSPARCSFSIAR